MPEQSIYFDKQSDAKRVQVVKVYDGAYARSCFDEMDEGALAFLSTSLDLPSKYELSETGSELAWEDVAEEAREDGNRLSFFVVVEEKDNHSEPIYVSPDWPSAERFANTRL